jgi:hypothetical protein
MPPQEPRPSFQWINAWLLGLVWLPTLLLAACDIRKTTYPLEQGVPLTVTLSSDGQVLAVLDSNGTQDGQISTAEAADLRLLAANEVRWRTTA